MARGLDRSLLTDRDRDTIASISGVDYPGFVETTLCSLRHDGLDLVADELHLPLQHYGSEHPGWCVHMANEAARFCRINARYSLLDPWPEHDEFVRFCQDHTPKGHSMATGSLLRLFADHLARADRITRAEATRQVKMLMQVQEPDHKQGRGNPKMKREEFEALRRKKGDAWEPRVPVDGRILKPHDQARVIQKVLNLEADTMQERRYALVLQCLVLMLNESDARGKTIRELQIDAMEYVIDDQGNKCYVRIDTVDRFGNKCRRPVSTVTASAFLKELRKVHPAWRLGNTVLFDPGSDAYRPLGGKKAQKMLEALGSSVGVAGLTTHMIRRTVASRWCEAGASLEEVRAKLGHAHGSSSTRDYLYVIEDEHLNEMRRARGLPLKGRLPECHGCSFALLPGISICLRCRRAVPPGASDLSPAAQQVGLIAERLRKYLSGRKVSG